VTLLEVLRRATGYLEQHDSSSPRLDAELLLAHALGLRRIDLYTQFERPLAEEELRPYRDLLARRGKGEPVAYLVGHKEFMKLDFTVTPAVLVPNPDTEVLVERAVTWGRARRGSLHIVDVGTGSGCIAVAVAHYLPEALVWATDNDSAALEVAASNVGQHGLEERVTLRRGDLLDSASQKFDLICANLPYLEPGTELPREVLAQPSQALFAAGGGAALVQRLLREAPSALVTDGIVLVEIGPEIQPVLELSGFAGHRFHRDLAGLVRVLEAWI
jgi:release factor glutamine methyltransferase